MEAVGIIWNTEKEETWQAAQRISAYLKEHGMLCYISPDGRDLPEACGCAIVLGGDGTLLRAAKVVLNRQLPLIGINLGNLGYLAEIDVNGIYPALDRLLRGEYTVEKRMMLEGTVVCKGKTVYTDVALNDISINRLRPIRTHCLRAYVNGTDLNTYRADGVIISTATGSTAYSLSVGGPIVSPEAQLLLMTPVAPHSLISRSIIFSGTDRVRIEIGIGSTGPVGEVVAARFDGAAEVLMGTGDYVDVCRAGLYTNIIKMNNISFLDVLRRKMSDA